MLDLDLGVQSPDLVLDLDVHSMDLIVQSQDLDLDVQ